MPRKLSTLIVAAAAIIGVAGCSGTSSSPTSSNGNVGDGYQFGADSSNITFDSPGDRKMVGDVSGTTLAGKPLSLASYRGKVVVVDFWSDDCGPCHGEEQSLEALSQSYASKGVQFVGIDERDNLSSGQAFEQQYHVTYPSLFDRDDAYVLDFPGAAPPSTPTTIVLDRTGHIAGRVDGEQDYTHFKTLIAAVVAESSTNMASK